MPFEKNSEGDDEASQPTPPSLTTLPNLVAKKLLMYLNVDSLESLSATCSYFDELISCRFLTSIDFPLPQEFISEVATASRLEKKPLLKLRYKKTDDELWNNILNLVHYSSITTSNYMLQSHLCLLSLDKIREFDLVPGGLSRSEVGVRMVTTSTSSSWKYEGVDYLLLRCIKNMGSLEHVTRLDILLNPKLGSFQHQYILVLPSLLELGLTMLEDQDMR